MPNILDANGLQLATRDEWVAFFTTAYQEIYGSDINLASDTPDGQMMNIQIQAILDVQELLMAVYNSFAVQNAIGVTLDQRVALTGIERQGGTYTVTPVTVVTSASVNLYGLDQDEQDVYTLSDNAGNKWELQQTQISVPVGANVFNFQAAVPGAQLTIPNTITIQFTVVLGVVSVNNPTAAASIGVNEETDAALKVRQQKSVSLASQGYLQGLLAALQNIPGMTSAFVYENNSDTTDADGVPSHSIWVIVAGSAAPADIAQAIYVKRNAGAGMYGQQTYDVLQIDGSLFTVRWDDVIVINLFIRFTATSLNGVTPPNIQSIVADLPATFKPSVFEEVNINGLATEVQNIDPNTLVTNAGFSTGQTQIFNLSGIAASGSFKINYNGNTSDFIDWDDDLATIQAKVQAVQGLAPVTVSGSIASKTLTFNLTAITNVLDLLFVESNTLQTSAPAPITFAYDGIYADTLTPTSKNNQFVVLSENIIVVPPQLFPTSSQVAPLGTVQYSAYGGYGSYIFSLQTNNSGGNIVPTTGLYTAGSTGLVTDIVKVVDSFGNSATASAIVT